MYFSRIGAQMRFANSIRNFVSVLIFLYITSWGLIAAEPTENVNRMDVKRLLPSVVHIESKSVQQNEGRGGRPPRVRRIEETGSGVIINISEQKYVLTNRHIIADAQPDSIQVFLSDRRVLGVKQILSSEDFDIALLSVDGDNLVAATVGDSDMVEITDPVFVFGSPFGLSWSVSFGIISAKGRRKIPQGGQLVPIQDFLQTDATVNPGNSGGPMSNNHGEVIGIVTAIASSGGGSEGVAFAIPINDMIRVANELVKNGTVIRPYLGIDLDTRFGWPQARTAGLDRNIGARIGTITPNSPAEQAGLVQGDIVLSYNGTTVEDDSHLVLLVAKSKIGETPSLEVLRNKSKMIIKPKLGGMQN